MQLLFIESWQRLRNQFVGDCYSGQNAHKSYVEHGVASSCVSQNHIEQPCSKDEYLCSGEMSTNFVYRIAPTGNPVIISSSSSSSGFIGLSSVDEWVFNYGRIFHVKTGQLRLVVHYCRKSNTKLIHWCVACHLKQGKISTINQMPRNVIPGHLTSQLVLHTTQEIEQAASNWKGWRRLFCVIFMTFAMLRCQSEILFSCQESFISNAIFFFMQA